LVTTPVLSHLYYNVKLHIPSQWMVLLNTLHTARKIYLLTYILKLQFSTQWLPVYQRTFHKLCYQMHMIYTWHCPENEAYMNKLRSGLSLVCPREETDWADLRQSPHVEKTPQAHRNHPPTTTSGQWRIHHWAMPPLKISFSFFLLFCEAMVYIYLRYFIF